MHRCELKLKLKLTFSFHFPLIFSESSVWRSAVVVVCVCVFIATFARNFYSLVCFTIVDRQRCGFYFPCSYQLMCIYSLHCTAIAYRAHFMCYFIRTALNWDIVLKSICIYSIFIKHINYVEPRTGQEKTKQIQRCNVQTFQHWIFNGFWIDWIFKTEIKYYDFKLFACLFNERRTLNSIKASECFEANFWFWPRSILFSVVSEKCLSNIKYLYISIYYTHANTQILIRRAKSADKITFEIPKNQKKKTSNNNTVWLSAFCVRDRIVTKMFIHNNKSKIPNLWQ